MRYRIYRNLRKQCWSIQEKVDGRWIVTQRRDEVIVMHARFKVSPAGRARCLRERRKNVHAYLLTDHIMEHNPRRLVVGERITYNPFKHETFVDTHNGEPVHDHTGYLLLSCKGNVIY
jgi:hypothetical protein